MQRPQNQSILYFALLLIIVIPLFSFGLANHGLWTADEPRVAEVGREMALTGNWSVPFLNERPFLEHPPLYYASVAAAFKVFGVHDWVARIPSALFAFAGVVALFLLAAFLMGPRAGFISGVVMATCGEYFRVAHWVIVDSALAFFVILALLFFMVAYFSEGRMRRLLFYGLSYVACTLAFFTKGFIGIVLPGAAVVCFLAFDRNIREVLRMHLWLAVLIFLAMTAPWFLSLWSQGGSEYLGVFLVHNHLERFSGGSSGHHQPFYYYFLQFPAAFLPWSLLMVPVILRFFRRSDRTTDRAGKGALFMACWFAAGFVVLSVASTKRALYLMPLFAPVSLLVAAYIESTLKKSFFGKVDKVFVCLFGLLPCIAAMAAIPGLLMAAKKYGIALPAKELAFTIFFSLASMGLSVASFWSLRARIARFWAFSAASILSLLLLGLIAAMPVLDNFKTFVPFTEAIRASVPSSSDLYAYQPDETLRGAVPFYTGRFVKEIDTLPRLKEALGKEKTLYVVIRDRRGEMERELLAAGMAVVFRQSRDTGRALVILKGGQG